MRVLSLWVVLAGSMGATEAIAAPPPAHGEMSHREHALHEVVAAERALVQGVLDAIRGGVEPGGSLNLSPAAKVQWESAKSLHKEAVALADAQRWRPAYVKFREAAKAVEPVLAELLDKPNPPPEVTAAIEAEIRQTAAMIDKLAGVVGPHVDDPAAKAAYADAKSTYTHAKELWDKPGEGNRKEAAREVWRSLEKLDVAIRAAYPEK